ncbi:hypothetical protein J7M23_06050, partial [Candidatus Sumerlaeota bacterium]|nr:hypothetical protein [Candidatus Sumerlaeota bacterium]
SSLGDLSDEFGVKDEEWEKLLRLEHNWGNIGSKQNDIQRIEWAQESLESARAKFENNAFFLLDLLSFNINDVILLNPLNWEISAAIRSSEGRIRVIDVPPLGFRLVSPEELNEVPQVDKRWNFRVKDNRIKVNYDGKEICRLSLWYGKGGKIPNKEWGFFESLKFNSEIKPLRLKSKESFPLHTFTAWTPHSECSISLLVHPDSLTIQGKVAVDWKEEENTSLHLVMEIPEGDIIYGTPFGYQHFGNEASRADWLTRAFNRWVFFVSKNIGFAIENHYFYHKGDFNSFILLNNPGHYSGDPYLNNVYNNYEFRFLMRKFDKFNGNEMERLGLENETPFFVYTGKEYQSGKIKEKRGSFLHLRGDFILSTLLVKDNKLLARGYNLTSKAQPVFLNGKKIDAIQPFEIKNFVIKK